MLTRKENVCFNHHNYNNKLNSLQRGIKRLASLVLNSHRNFIEKNLHKPFLHSNCEFKLAAMGIYCSCRSTCQWTKKWKLQQIYNNKDITINSVCLVLELNMSAADQAVQSGSYTYTATSTVTQTTTQTATRTSWFPSIKPGFDHTYFRSIEGMLRVASLVSFNTMS